MRMPILTLAICMFATANAAETAWQLAPELTTLKASMPDEYRTLEDGTWDTFSLDDKMDFVHRLSRKAVGLADDPESDAAQERRVDRILAAVKRSSDPDALERTYTKGLLLRIETANTAASIPGLARAGGDRALNDFINEQQRKLDKLRREHPDLDLPESVFVDNADTEGPTNASDRSSSSPFPGTGGR